MDHQKILSTLGLIHILSFCLLTCIALHYPLKHWALHKCHCYKYNTDLSAAFDTADYKILLWHQQFEFGMMALAWQSSYLTAGLGLSSYGSSSHPSSGGTLAFLRGPSWNLCCSQYTVAQWLTSLWGTVSTSMPTTCNSISPWTTTTHPMVCSYSPCALLMTDNGLWTTNFSSTWTSRWQWHRSLVAASYHFDCVTEICCWNRSAISLRYKVLGILLDKHLMSEKHITAVVWSYNYHAQAIHHVHHLLATELTTLILTKQDYCNSLLHGYPTSSTLVLQHVQNNATSITVIACMAIVAPAALAASTSRNWLYVGCVNL